MKFFEVLFNVENCKEKSVLQSLIDTSEQIIIATDANNNITTWNKKASEITEISYWKALNQNFDHVIKLENESTITQINSKTIEFKKYSINNHGTILIGNQIRYSEPEKGSCYYCKSRTELYRISKDYIDKQHKCMFIGREYNQLGHKNLLLTDIISPDHILEQIKQFIESGKTIICIDRVDYLITQFGFDNFLKLIYNINDQLTMDSIAIFYINQIMLNERQKCMLDLEIQPLVRNLIHPTLQKIILFIHEAHKKGIPPTHSDIYNMLGMCKQTMRKKMSELETLKLIETKKMGRAKYIYLTEIGASYVN